MLASVNNYNYQNKNNLNITFKSNPDSLKLALKNKDFFIRIQGYDKKEDWAEKMIKLTDETVQSIRRGLRFDTVLTSLAKNMRKFNKHLDKNGFNHTGILRTKREGYRNGPWFEHDLYTTYERFGDVEYNMNSQYYLFKPHFDKMKRHPLKNPYNNINLTRVFYNDFGSFLWHGDARKINNALDYAGNIYKSLQTEYVKNPQNVTKKSLEDINSRIAELRWVLAHSMPFERGSDAISNSFMRALYKSMGIKTYPAKRGVSFDLQAYYTELDDYKKNFAKYFKKSPKVIDDNNSLLSGIVKKFKNLKLLSM